MVVVAQSSNLVATVYINTSINPNLFVSDTAKACHHPILQSNNTYLDYDSFASCVDLKERDLSSLRAMVAADANIYKGELHRPDLLKAIELLKGGGIIKPKLLVKYGLR